MLQFCDYFKEAWIIVRTGEARGSVIMRPVVQPPRKTISGSNGFTLAASVTLAVGGTAGSYGDLAANSAGEHRPTAR